MQNTKLIHDYSFVSAKSGIPTLNRSDLNLKSVCRRFLTEECLKKAFPIFITVYDKQSTSRVYTLIITKQGERRPLFAFCG